MDRKMLLACVTGSVDEELLLRNEYLITENRILRHQIEGRMRLTDAERQTLAELGKKLGKQALEEVANIVKPDTILAWHRKLVAEKFDGSEQQKSVGRPRVDKDLEDLIVQMARDNRQEGTTVMKSQVIDHGDGPKIEDTRITVYAVLDYLQAGRTRDWIAAMLHLSSEQVQAAMDYIHEHHIEVHTDYERIMSRIQQGHSDEAEARLQANRAKVQARLASQKTSSR